MSNLATTAHDTLAVDLNPVPQKRHLRAVNAAKTSAKRRSPVFLTTVSILGIVAIFLTQLWINLAVSSAAYEISDLKIEQKELSRMERVARLDVNKLASPQNLAQQAADLGMVQNLHPTLLKLDNSTLIGKLNAGTANPSSVPIANSALEETRLADQAVISGEEKTRTVANTEPAVAAAPQPAETDDKNAENTSDTPVVWEGKLKGPKTR